MSGTTTNYAFPYPTSGDLVRDGATAIQSLADSIDSFIGGSEAAGKLFDVADSNVTTSSTTTSTTPANIPTNPNQLVFTTGKSGLFMVIAQAQMSNSSASNTSFISPDITGAVTSTSSSLRAGAVPGTVRGSASWIGLFDGTGNTSTTINLHAWTSSAGTATITWSRITVICLG